MRTFIFGIVLGVVFAYISYSSFLLPNKMFQEPKLINLNVKDNYFDLEGQPFQFPNKKEITLIGLWGTYCPPCIEKLPQLNKIGEAYPNINIVLVSHEETDVILNFLDYTPYNHATFIKSKGRFSQMGAYVVPKYILVENGQGRLLDDIQEFYDKYPIN